MTTKNLLPKRIGLTAKFCETVKYIEGGKNKHPDGGNLYLVVTPKGKLWHITFRFNNSRNTYSIGKYPTISLAEAREERNRIEKLIKQGINPNEQKKIQKNAVQIEKNGYFETNALEWFEWKSKEEWRSKTHAQKQLGYLKNDLLPILKDKQLSDFTPDETKTILKKIDTERGRETTRRIMHMLSGIFEYGIDLKRCEYNPVKSVSKYFPKSKSTHFPALTETEDFKPFVIDLYSTKSNHLRVDKGTIIALKLVLHTATRPDETCKAQWKDFDFTNNIWTIPEDNKKEYRELKIPLTKQVITLLEELRPYTEHTGFLFPAKNKRNQKGYISRDSLSKFVRETLKYKGKQTVHGLRACFSSILHQIPNDNNKGLMFNHEIIEASLGHVTDNATSQAYNRGNYFNARKELMQFWSDYLDELRTK